MDEFTWLQADSQYVRTEHGTLVIGLSFIFLAYMLHPIVDSAYQRVRAYRAWRAIENHDRVEVTSYPMAAELCGGRGKWDAARIITVLLLAFSLASWILELSLGLKTIEGNVELLTLAPSIFKKNGDSNSAWQVLNLTQISGYDGELRNFPNIDYGNGKAKSSYKMENLQHPIAEKNPENGVIYGEIVVASWPVESTDVEEVPDFSYKVVDDDDTVMVAGLGCSPEKTVSNASVTISDENGEEEWGHVLECGQGPLQINHTTAQPAIILTKKSTENSTPETHIIVEEAAQHPSFLYSVWTTNATVTAADNEDLVAIKHAFYIESTVRLAEAVVTGIVHGETGGGGCFSLLQAFSEREEKYNSTSIRASPFGETPMSSNKTVLLEEVETITYGIEIGMSSMVSSMWLLALTSIGLAWSFCLRKSIGMDVYNRDELLRAVSLQAQGLPDDPERHASMRIFVQKELGGHLNVIISESDDDMTGCKRFLLRRGPKAIEDPAPVADANDRHGGAPLPSSRTHVLVDGSRLGFGYVGGARTGYGRAYPGRRNDFRHPDSRASSLTTPSRSGAGSATGSPVPSTTGLAAVAGVPVSHCPTRGGSFVLAASPVPSPAATPVRSNAGSAAGTPTLPRPHPGGRRGGFVVVLGASPARSSFSSITEGSVHSNIGSLTGTPVTRRSSRLNISHPGGREGGLPNFTGLGRGPSILFDESVCSTSMDGGETDGEFSRGIEMGMTGLSARPQVPAYGGSVQGGVANHPRSPVVRHSSPVPLRGLQTMDTLGPPQMGPLIPGDDAV